MEQQEILPANAQIRARLTDSQNNKTMKTGMSFIQIMRFILSSLFVTLVLSSCNGNPGKDPEKSKQPDLTPKKEIRESKPDSVKPTGKTIAVGYYDNYEKVPKLVFDSISESEFNQLKARKYLTKIQPEKKGNEFQIQTAVRKHSFKKYKDYGEPENWSGYELKGYYPKLKLYALTENSTAEHLGFGELFLVDSITDYRYAISSFGDGSVETPIPSVNGKYLVYYYNEVYENGVADIGILKVNDKTKPDSYLKEHAIYHASDFGVEEIRWKSDHTFYVKAFREIRDEATGEWVRTYGYYKTSFK